MSTLLACSWDGSCCTIDPTTGAGTVIGPTGFSGLNSLASDSSGTVYSVGGKPLIKIDPNTGVGTLVKDLQPGSDVRAMAFSPSNILFAIRNGGGPGDTTTPDELVNIDVTTGAVTVVGNTGVNALQAMAFSPNGTLYGWDLSRGLMTINTSTGIGTAVNPAMALGSGPDIQGLSFAPDGTLFGARESLFKVDVTTGATTVVGSGGYSDVRGIAFLREPGVSPNLDDLRHIYSDFVKIIGSVPQAGGEGWGIHLGGRVIPIPPFDPESPWKRLSQAQQDALIVSSVSTLLAALFSSVPRG